MQRQCLRRRAGAAAGHYQDQVERIRHPDHAQQQRRGDHAGQTRQRDVAKFAPCAGAVDRRGFIEFAWDRLQTRQQGHREERKSLPHHRDDHTRHRGAGLGKPGNRMRQDTELHANVVQHAQIEVEHPRPDKPNDHRWQRPGHHDQRSRDAAPGEAAVQQKGGGKAKSELQRDGANHPDQRIAQALPEHGIAECVRIVCQADERAQARAIQDDVVQRKPQGVEYRQQHQNGCRRQCGRQHQPGGGGGAEAMPPPPDPLPQGEGGCAGRRIQPKNSFSNVCIISSGWI